VHYDDLNRDRATETQRLLEACGVSSRHVERAMAAFAKDSHTGSVGANATPARSLNAQETARAVKLLALMGKRAYVGERLPESRVGTDHTQGP
jgi:hypothetical protein